MKKKLKISPSQIANKRDCLRKWLFQNFLYLPTVKKLYFTLGTVLHGVLERWLKADENGRDENGQAVELYPEDWHVVEEKDGTKNSIGEEEQDLVRDLVQLAIEQGLVERTPGRLIEEYFAREIIEDVILHGYLDVQVLDDLRVEDFKTTKSKKYILSEEKLRKDVKMRCYAIEVAMRHFDKTGEQPEAVKMALNYMVKDPLKPEVRKREVEVPVEELEWEWERIIEDAEEMKRWAEKYENYLDFEKKPNYTTLDHEEIPGPENNNVCNKYGGCAYQNICTGRETVQQYYRRVDKILHPSTVKEKRNMGSIFADRLKEIKAARGTAVAEKEPEAPPAAPEDDGQNTEQPELPMIPPPPWTNKDCSKCKDHPGLDEHGEACPICFKLAKKAGLPLPAQCRYDAETEQWIVYSETKDDEPLPVISSKDNGEILKDQTEKRQEVPQEPADKAKPSAKTQSKPRGVNPLQAAKEAREKAAAAKAAAETEEVEKEAAEKSTRAKAKADDGRKTSSKMGRPPMGFTLCIGVAPMRTGTREIVYAEQLLDKAKEMITSELKQQYEEQDSFQRRDMVVVAVREMVESLGSAIVISSNLKYASQDLRAIVEELKVHAQTVFAPTEY